MSLTSALFTGVSGLLNQAEGINVIGNNISNVNTVGFKGSRTLFSDVLSTTLGGGSQMGHGVQLQKIDTMFTQSPTESTGSTSDVAIQGERLFVLAKPGTTSATTPVTLPAEAYYTRAGSFRMNGQATATLAGTLINPDGYVVLDAQARPIEIALTDGGVIPKTFQKITGIDAKGVITMQYADSTGGTSSYYYSGPGTVLLAPIAANYLTVTTPATSAQLGTVKIGNPPGMEKIGGTLFQATAQSGIPDPAATTLWASNGVTEKIFSNSLESSNVDMATEFVKMILTQRAYSANSKTITTADEMTQEVINLKR